MKKLLKRSLLSILALSTVLSFTTLTNKVHAKSDVILDINEGEIKPAYVTDYFFGLIHLNSLLGLIMKKARIQNLKFHALKEGNEHLESMLELIKQKN